MCSSVHGEHISNHSNIVKLEEENEREGQRERESDSQVKARGVYKDICLVCSASQILSRLLDPCHTALTRFISGQQLR